MTILQLTNTRVSDEYPEARSIVACARALADAGHDITLITPAEERSGRLFDRAPRFRAAAIWQSAAGAPPEEAPANPPALVHVHHPFLVGEEALRLAARHDAPLVFTATLRYENPFPLPAPEASLLGSFIEKLGICYANRCDLVVAPSAAVALRLFDAGVTRPIHVVPGGEPPTEQARRLLEVYAEALATRRSRGPVRDSGGAAGRLHRELALAWNKIHPAAAFPVRSRGVFASLLGRPALPC